MISTFENNFAISITVDVVDNDGSIYPIQFSPVKTVSKLKIKASYLANLLEFLVLAKLSNGIKQFFKIFWEFFLDLFKVK